MPLCPHLAPIVAAELAAGIRVERTFETGYTRCRLQVTLAEPFHLAHEEGPLPSVVTPHDDTDSHYPLGGLLLLGAPARRVRPVDLNQGATHRVTYLITN